MKTKLYYSLISAILIVLSACSSKVTTNSSTSLKQEKTLLDVVKDNVKGFNVGMWPSVNAPRAGLVGGSAGTFSVPFAKKMSYKIYDKELHLIIDGVDVERFYSPNGSTTGDYVQDRNKASVRDRMQYIENYLVNIKAEEIKDVKLISDSEYSEKYKSASANRIDGSLSVATTSFAYVEVNTRSGNGAFMK